MDKALAQLTREWLTKDWHDMQTARITANSIAFERTHDVRRLIKQAAVVVSHSPLTLAKRLRRWNRSNRGERLFSCNIAWASIAPLRGRKIKRDGGGSTFLIHFFWCNVEQEGAYFYKCLSDSASTISGAFSMLSSSPLA
jgi:hypothetical protein